MTGYSADEIAEKVSTVLRRYDVERAYLYGSYARGTASDVSDIDLRLDTNLKNSLRLAEILLDLQKAFDCTVDFVTTRMLDPEYLESIREHEILIYERERP